MKFILQADRESFLKYLDRFKNLLFQCHHHGLDQARLSQIIYEGPNQQNRTMVKSMCQGGFLSKSPTNAWEFLEDLAGKKKTMEWKTTRDDNLNSGYNRIRGGIHTVSELSHLQSRFMPLKI